MVTSNQRYFRKWDNKTLVTEYNRIKNKAPSSWSWGSTNRKNIRAEFHRRKKEGMVRSDAGKSKKSHSGMGNFGGLDFNFGFKF